MELLHLVRLILEYFFCWNAAIPTLHMIRASPTQYLLAKVVKPPNVWVDSDSYENPRKQKCSNPRIADS